MGTSIGSVTRSTRRSEPRRNSGPCEVAAGHLGMVIDDIVPGHTGKGWISAWPR